MSGRGVGSRLSAYGGRGGYGDGREEPKTPPLRGVLPPLPPAPPYAACLPPPLRPPLLPSPTGVPPSPVAVPGAEDPMTLVGVRLSRPLQPRTSGEQLPPLPPTRLLPLGPPPAPALPPLIWPAGPVDVEATDARVRPPATTVGGMSTLRCARLYLLGAVDGPPPPSLPAVVNGAFLRRGRDGDGSSAGGDCEGGIVPVALRRPELSSGPVGRPAMSPSGIPPSPPECDDGTRGEAARSSSPVAAYTVGDGGGRRPAAAVPGEQAAGGGAARMDGPTAMWDIGGPPRRVPSVGADAAREEECGGNRAGGARGSRGALSCSLPPA